MIRKRSSGTTSFLIRTDSEIVFLDLPSRMDRAAHFFSVYRDDSSPDAL